MGFHKRYINKDILLYNISNLDKLFKADALMMDSWVTKFYHDLNPKEREIRKKIKVESKEVCPDKHVDYCKLQSLSENLISLKTNPDWLDIHFTQEKLGRFNLSIEEFGNLEKMIQKSIDSIINYYD